MLRTLLRRCARLLHLPSEDQAKVCELVPTLFTVLESNDMLQSPSVLGGFLLCIIKCVRGMLCTLLQNPSSYQVRILTHVFLDIIKEVYPEVRSDENLVTELVNVSEYFLRKSKKFPIPIDIARYSSQEFIEWATKYTRKTYNEAVLSIVLAVYDHLESKRMSTLDFRKAFDICMRAGGEAHVPWVAMLWGSGGQSNADTMAEFAPDTTPTEYVSTGDYIAMDQFSAEYLVPEKEFPKDAECGACTCELTIQELRTGSLVSSKCGHLFHASCLDIWVNVSAMSNAHACPVCRTILCKPRTRAHAVDLGFGYGN